MRSSMWSTMPTPWRAPSAATRSISSTSPSRSPSSATGSPRSNSSSIRCGSSGASRGGVDELEDVLVGGVVEILDPAALGRAAPEVVVDRVGRDLGAALDRDPVLARVLDLLLAPHRPLAHRRDHLQLGRQRRDRAVDAHLVVALAGAAVRDRVAAGAARVLDRELRDQRPAERGEQRVGAAVERVGLDRRRDVLARELLARVDEVALDRADPARLALDHREVLARLAEIDRQRHDLGAVALADPAQHHARVEAAAVEQQHAPDLRPGRPRSSRSAGGMPAHPCRSSRLPGKGLWPPPAAAGNGRATPGLALWRGRFAGLSR